MTNNKKKRSFEYSGKTYESKKVACEELGIPYQSVFSRSYKHKIPFEEALDDYLHEKVKKKGLRTVIIDGKVYDTIKMACDDLGISYKYAMNKRRMEEVTIQLAIEKILAEKAQKIEKAIAKENAKKSRLFVYHGATYPSLKEACQIHGVTPHKVYMRANKNNISHQEALDNYVNNQVKKQAYKVKFGEKIFPSIKSACKELGLRYTAIMNEAAKRGMTGEEVIEHVIDDCAKWIRKGNDLGKVFVYEKFASFLEMSDHDLADSVLTNMQRSLGQGKASKEAIADILIKRAERVRIIAQSKKTKKRSL